MREVLILFFLIIFMLSSSFTSNSQDIELSWSFLHPIKKEWIELGVKGCVQEGLIANKELPDPFYGLNEEMRTINGNLNPYFLSRKNWRKSLSN